MGSESAGVAGPGEGDGRFECVRVGEGGDAKPSLTWPLTPLSAGVIGSTLTPLTPFTAAFGVDGSALTFDAGDGDGEGVGIAASFFFFKKLWSTVNWMA
jgi:hypothetical protein